MCQHYDVYFLTEHLTRNEAEHGDTYSQADRLRESRQAVFVAKVFPDCVVRVSSDSCASSSMRILAHQFSSAKLAEPTVGKDNGPPEHFILSSVRTMRCRGCNYYRRMLVGMSLTVQAQ